MTPHLHTHHQFNVTTQMAAALPVTGTAAQSMHCYARNKKHVLQPTSNQTAATVQPHMDAAHANRREAHKLKNSRCLLSCDTPTLLPNTPCATTTVAQAGPPCAQDDTAACMYASIKATCNVPEPAGGPHPARQPTLHFSLQLDVPGKHPRSEAVVSPGNTLAHNTTQHCRLL